MLILILCVFINFYGSKGIVSTGGREFLVTFQENEIYGGNIPRPQCITLTTCIDTNVSVEVRSLYPEVNFRTNTTITNTAGDNICLDNSMTLDGTGISSKVVRVISQEDINVMVNDVEAHSVDSYPAIPVKEFGTEYYVMSYSYDSQFSVTAFDNGTEVRIEFPSRLKTSSSYEVQYKGVTFINPAVMTIFLQKHEVYNLFIKQDLTGLFVSSSKPIAVISGNRKIRTRKPAGRDHLAQQMPPVETWGRDFITVPSPEKKKPDIYRILTSGPSTTVDIGNSSYSLENEGDWFDVELLPATAVKVQSNTAILVVKLVTNDDDIEPCMMLVVPVEQWHYEYSFRFPGSDGYLLVVIDTSSRTSLLLNSEPLDTFQWIEVDNTNSSVGYRLLTNSYYTLKSNTADIVFAAYMHQTTRRFAFCSQVGMKLEKLDTNWNHTKINSDICRDTSTSTVVPTTAVSTTTTTTTSTSVLTTSVAATTDTASTTVMASTVDEERTDSTTTVAVASICNTTGTTSIGSTEDGTTTPKGNEETEKTGTNGNCFCQDEFLHMSNNISNEDINEITTRFKVHLMIIPNQTSRAIRKKISAPDYRPSAMAFGIAGWSVLVSAMAAICICDLPQTLRHLRQGTK